MTQNSDHSPSPSMQEAMRLAQSESGQRLLSLLHSSHRDQINVLAETAKTGDMAQIKSVLNSLLSDPEVRSIISQLGGESHG